MSKGTVQPRGVHRESLFSMAAHAIPIVAMFIMAVAAVESAQVLQAKEPGETAEAKEAAETYTDIEHVESQGGLLGMDHHMPPPAPKILSKDERRSDDSGYVRPLRRR